MQAKIIVGDIVGRWKAGEIGTVLTNDFPKYDYFIELKRKLDAPNRVRRLYFYEDEIEILK